MPGKFSFEKTRTEKLRKIMEESGVDMMLVPPGPNFFYFTGFETEAMERLTLLAVARDRISVVGPKLMEEQLEENTWVEDVISWADDENPYRIVRDIMEKEKVATVALDGSIPYFHFAGLFEKMSVRQLLGDPYMSALRKIKDSEEIERIAQAVSRSEAALKTTLDSINDEATEKSLAGILEENMLRSGVDSIAFRSIVAAGENSSVPHHSRGDRPIRKHEPIVIDFGGSYKGYASDTTRTVFIDTPSPEMEEIYEITREAQDTPIRELRSDSSYADADRMARNVIDARGYGNRFIHRLGHGLGISVHEEPYLVPSNTENVAENAVFTIEPGIYIPGKGGVRIEDTVRFSGGRCLPFNRFSKDITIL